MQLDMDIGKYQMDSSTQYIGYCRTSEFLEPIIITKSSIPELASEVLSKKPFWEYTSIYLHGKENKTTHPVVECIEFKELEDLITALSVNNSHIVFFEVSTF